jgi:hypothetical protein
MTLARQQRRRLRHPPGLFWAPGNLHGCETLMAVAPDGEMTLRTVEPGTTGDDAIGQLEGWLRGHGFTPSDDAPSLYVL